MFLARIERRMAPEGIDPSIPAAAIAPAPAPTAAPAPAPSTPSVEDPAWLNARIAQAKGSAERDALKAIGAASLEEAKAKLEKLAQLEEQAKTDAEKTREKIASLEAAAAKKVELEASLATVAKGVVESLTEPQRAAVKAIAGDDPAKIISAVEALRPSWATPAQTKPEPVPAPSTAPSGTVPSPSTAQPGTLTPYQQWKALQPNPFAAAAFYREHAAEIDKERFASSGR